MVWVLAAALAAGITDDVRVAVFALFLLLWFAWRANISRLEIVCLLTSAFLFFLYGYLSIESFRRDIGRVSAQAGQGGESVSLDGWVSSFPRYRYGGMGFEFRTRVSGLECAVLVQTKEFLVCYGDSLRLTGVWKKTDVDPVGRRDNRLMAKGVCGEFRAAGGGVERLGGVGGSWVARKILFPCHDRIRRELCRGLGSRSGLPIAVLIGETGYLDRRVSEAFRSLGISHLIALSGQHLTFVAGCLIVVLGVLGRASSGLILAGLSLYVAVVGFIVSLYRAFVMAVVVIAGSAVKRRIDPVTVLADAFVIVLLLFPYTFFSVGFQLSFAATLAVFLCVRTLERPGSKNARARVWFAIRSSFQVSLAAQLFVTPVIIEYFDRVSVLSPVGTLVFVVPVVSVLLLSGVSAIACVLAPLTGPVLFAGLDRAVGGLQTALVATANLLPGTVPLMAPNPWLYYAGVALIVFSRRRRKRKAAGALVVALSFGVAMLAQQLF